MAATVAAANGNGGAGGHGGSNNGLTYPAPAANGGGGKGARERVSPMDKYWVPADEGDMAAAAADGGEDGRRPLLYRTFGVKGVLLHPYRCVSIIFAFAPREFPSVNLS
ncbi:hypothetical protein GUJ93_ZPchr0007g4568 [Zizania palustris]|uniref:Uncharacterized protein n=1 Tax=Zizania palustris TaxID=103762 RepID=A0A8J5TE86_ZIZPA|nr:hypothetical protein GUJ93_ZPchr0007g4568 [Zizania palustris]